MFTAQAMSDTVSDSDRGIFADKSKGDPRGARILAKTIYRDLRAAGMCERDVVAIATELLAQTAADLKSSR